MCWIVCSAKCDRVIVRVFGTAQVTADRPDEAAAGTPAGHDKGSEGREEVVGNLQRMFADTPMTPASCTTASAASGQLPTSQGWATAQVHCVN
jgi:hypothetical protein